MLGEETDLARCPDWYTFFKAAKWLGVAPWELADQSIYWQRKAVIAMNAEAEAQQILDDRARKTAKPQGGIGSGG